MRSSTSHETGIGSRDVVPTLVARDQLQRRWANALLVPSLLLILSATLFPFEFSANGWPAKLGRFLVPKGRFIVDIEDIVDNLVLFIPLGFALASAAYARNRRTLPTLFVALILSVVLSFSIETTQVFLPSRVSSLVDVAMNALGGFGGAILFRVAGARLVALLSGVFEGASSRFTFNRLILAWSLYLLALIALCVPVQRESALEGWDEGYHVVVGNEYDASMPWRGHVGRIAVADHILDRHELEATVQPVTMTSFKPGSLVAAYSLKGDEGLVDITGTNPPLIWKGSAPPQQDSGGVFTGPQQWLQSASPAAPLTRRIMASKAFTLIASVAALDTVRPDFGCIVSLSSNQRDRNFTLGQSGSDLMFRFRTPKTGRNGMSPEFGVKGVFADTRIHRIVVSYDGADFKVYVDDPRNVHSLELGPGLILFTHVFPPNGRLDVNVFFSQFYKMMFYLFAFIPFGVLLAALVHFSGEHRIPQWLVAATGVVVPAVGLEAVLVATTGRSPTVANLVVSGGLIGATAILQSLAVNFWRPRTTTS